MDFVLYFHKLPTLDELKSGPKIFEDEGLHQEYIGIASDMQKVQAAVANDAEQSRKIAEYARSIIADWLNRGMYRVLNLSACIVNDYDTRIGKQEQDDPDGYKQERTTEVSVVDTAKDSFDKVKQLAKAEFLRADQALAKFATHVSDARSFEPRLKALGTEVRECIESNNKQLQTLHDRYDKSASHLRDLQGALGKAKSDLAQAEANTEIAEIGETVAWLFCPPVAIGMNIFKVRGNLEAQIKANEARIEMVKTEMQRLEEDMEHVRDQESAYRKLGQEYNQVRAGLPGLTSMANGLVEFCKTQREHALQLQKGAENAFEQTMELRGKTPGLLNAHTKAQIGLKIMLIVDEAFFDQDCLDNIDDILRWLGDADFNGIILSLKTDKYPDGIWAALKSKVSTTRKLIR